MIVKLREISLGTLFLYGGRLYEKKPCRFARHFAARPVFFEDGKLCHTPCNSFLLGADTNVELVEVDSSDESC